MISILRLNCPDAVGLLAQVTGAIAEQGGNLLEVSQYTDVGTGWFFARLAIEKGLDHWDAQLFAEAFAPHASRLRADWSIRAAEDKIRAVILVSKQDHCLVDLLWRWRCGELGIDVPLVVSNHEGCRALVEREQIPFEFISFEQEKPAAFEKLGSLLREARAELVVLARFMQILPGWLYNDTRLAQSISITLSFPPFPARTRIGVLSSVASSSLEPPAITPPRTWTPARSSSRRSRASNITTIRRTSFVSAATASALPLRGAFATMWKVACWFTAPRPSFFGTDH